MIQKNSNDLFRSVEKLLQKMAHQWARTYRLEYDECQSECYLGYARCVGKWNPEKGKLTTWVVFCVSNHMRRWVKIPLRQRQRDMQTNWQFDIARYDEPIMELSSDEKYMLTAVELVSSSKERSIKHVKRILKGEGWTNARFAKTADRLLQARSSTPKEYAVIEQCRTNA
jgi:DNA-directed RNA polymerase specialized sigma subunit